MSPFAPTKLKAQTIERLPPDLRHELPKRGLVLSVGNQHSTGRRVVVDIDHSSMSFHQRTSYPQGGKQGGKQKLSDAQLEELIAQANVFWASDPQYKEARRSAPDQRVTLVLVDQNQAKHFDSHDPADELHLLYEKLWQWAGAS